MIYDELVKDKPVHAAMTAADAVVQIVYPYGMAVLLEIAILVIPLRRPVPMLRSPHVGVDEEGTGIFLVHALSALDGKAAAVRARKRCVQVQRNGLAPGALDDGGHHIALGKIRCDQRRICIGLVFREHIQPR